MASIRNTYLCDYGISDSDSEKIIEICRNAGYEQQKMILDVINKIYPAISIPLFVNLTTGLGYDVISKRYHIPVQRKDFQGYRRTAISELRRYV